MVNETIKRAVERLATRSTQTEADIQSDIQTVLAGGELNLTSDDVVPKLEQPTGDSTRRRIDVAICHCVIEVKKDLRSPAVRADGEEQLRGYVQTRHQQYGRRFVGILTDGVDWTLYDLTAGGDLVEVSRLTNTGDADRLLVWIEAILASETAVPPVPAEIEQRLGANSPAHQLDFRELSALYEANRNNAEVALKRELWAKLLKTAFGSSFQDSSDTFINHTLLVLTAEIIAHAVLDIDISAAGPVSPPDLVTGRQFDQALIHGVVEADFFDWVVAVPGGEAFVRTLADRLSRFNWAGVEHDVLKHLYESIIVQESRQELGEYYTPDWLADRVVASTVTAPLTQRVLDPSCGSGTFVFHAVRAYLNAADADGVGVGDAIAGLTQHVLGMDIHPVAVTLARVTYLLAIGTDRLRDTERPEMTVPIYLGDSLQWEQNRDLFSRDDAVSIATTSDELVGEGGGIIGDDDLVFPVSVLKDAATFDRLVSRMADLALDNTGRKHRTLITPVLNQFRIAEEDRDVLGKTFATLRDLALSGRDHIWGYYVRNLIRPIWLAIPENRVDVLVGNPPWLRYSKMTPAMKGRYKALAKPRNLLSGGLGASGRDLSTLFVSRAVEMYLHPGGTFAFVMPHGTITRLPHTGFRSGKWASAQTGALTVAFGETWDLTDAPTGFPMVSCVITGTSTNPAVGMKPEVQRWTSTLSTPDVTWAAAENTFTITTRKVAQLNSDADLPVSPYKRKFRQGAILVPRVLVTVEDAPATALGAGAGRRLVRSRRTTAEKDPWRKVETLTGSVESQHIHPTHLGETIAPYRALDPILSVLPLGSDRLLLPSEIAEAPGLSGWWAKAEQAWGVGKVANDDSDLLTRVDYHTQLSSQLPIASHRVVYTKSGTALAAARVEDDRAVIDHKLYWAPVASVAEGRYLTGILNSETLLKRVTPLQNVGLFGPRDFDKNVFYVAFGPYDSTNADHQALIDLVEKAEEAAATVPIAAAFTTTRNDIRKALAAKGLLAQIEDVVTRILPVVAVSEDGDSARSAGGTGQLRRTSLEPFFLDEADVEIDLDVEYDRDQNVYLWGMLVRRRVVDRDPAYISIGSASIQQDFAELASEAVARLKDIVASAEEAGETVRLYHYGNAERQHLERLGGDGATLASMATDVLGLIRSRFSSTQGLGLKRIGALAGASWRTEGLVGDTTYDWIERARAGDAAAWEQLVKYNEDDVNALALVRAALRDYPDGFGGGATDVTA
ncbi:N-6 DNA methylase [Nocardioides sp. GY 10127]|uniref:N-6 DNA methylase n=1 Tax=Nocardioides sp. GY 10127 TaxID=2569762 RepID=UPI0010A94B37|nr:N-6 DNA methylase [Nocardioides sp. GY 10127]TIC86383.1 SAM-dependent DNA methyltransferase [Nocardioides sp. GY 10127]